MRRHKLELLRGGADPRARSNLRQPEGMWVGEVSRELPGCPSRGRVRVATASSERPPLTRAKNVPDDGTALKIRWRDRQRGPRLRGDAVLTLLAGVFVIGALAGCGGTRSSTSSPTHTGTTGTGEATGTGTATPVGCSKYCQEAGAPAGNVPPGYPCASTGCLGCPPQNCVALKSTSATASGGVFTVNMTCNLASPCRGAFLACVHFNAVQRRRTYCAGRRRPFGRFGFLCSPTWHRRSERRAHAPREVRPRTARRLPGGTNHRPPRLRRRRQTEPKRLSSADLE